MQSHTNINRSICSHFLSIGLLPEQRQKERHATFLTTESHRGWGVEAGIDSPWATCWLNMHHNGCAPERHRAAWWSTAFHGEQPLDSSQSAHCCLPMPVFSGFIQAIGGTLLGRTHVYVRDKVSHGAHVSSSSTGQQRKMSCLNCTQPIVASKNCAFANWFGIKCDTQVPTETVTDARLPGPYPTVCRPLLPCPEHWEDLKTPGKQWQGSFKNTSLSEEGFMGQKACFFFLKCFIFLKLLLKFVFVCSYYIYIFTHMFNLSLENLPVGLAVANQKEPVTLHKLLHVL